MPSRATETKGRYTHADFTTVLEQDPDSTEARKALHETFTLISERNNEEDESVAEEDCGPSLTDPGKELESVSDSSDCNHEGNGFPCRYYNHDGCMRGVECRYSHAPDHKSVRDRLYVFTSDLSLAWRNADFGRRPAGATFVCTSYSGTADLAVAYIPTARPICRLAGGGMMSRNGALSGLYQ